MSPPRVRRKRRYPRRTVRVEIEYRSEHGRALATATTLGAGGMFIATEEPLPRRTKLSVRFSLPDSPEHIHEIPARVVWCNRPQEDHTRALGMGIAFEDQRACASLAAQLEVEKPGVAEPDPGA